MAIILYSHEYNEFRVTVKGSTYYTSDKQDALGTCQLMQLEVRETSEVPKVKKATQQQEEAW